MLRVLYRKIYKICREVFSRRLTTLAASVTYYFVIAIVPFAVLFLGLSAMFGFDPIKAFDIENSKIPVQVIESLKHMYNANINFSSVTSIILVAFVVYLASGFFGHLISVGKYLYEKDMSLKSVTKYKKILQRPISIAMLMFFVALLITELYVSSFIIDTIIKNTKFFTHPVGIFLTNSLSVLIGAIFFLLGLVIVNNVISPPDVHFKDNLYGALLTYLIWISSSYLFFRIYKRGAPSNIFGDFAGYITIIYWAYIIAYGFIVGVLLNRYLYTTGRLRRKSLPAAAHADSDMLEKYFERNIQ